MDDMIYCSSCGASNKTQSTYCFQCGKVLLKNSETLTTDSATQMSSSMSTPTRTVSDGSASYLLNNRYTNLTLLGKGGMGAVYKAEDTRFSRSVAIKEMSQANLDAQRLQEVSEQFKQEAHILARLSHPNLPSIHDYFTENGRLFLVMDFIEGVTLEQYAATQPGKILPATDVLHIAIQLAKVLQYLHTRPTPIIFRDLKPANVMITPEKNVYLIDFGIARLFKQEQANDTVAYISQGYAAPEQFSTAQTTPQTDIYGLGATLYQMLTGIKPGMGTANFSFDMYAMPYSVPPELTTLIMRMVSLHPVDRPASMLLLGQELERIAQTLSRSSATAVNSISYGDQNLLTSTPVEMPASVYLGSAPPPFLDNNAQTLANGRSTLPPPPRKKPNYAFIVGIVVVLLCLIGTVSSYLYFSAHNGVQSRPGTALANDSMTATPIIVTATATVASVPTATPTTLPTAIPTTIPTSIPYPSYSDAQSAIKYYYVTESDFKGKNVIQQFNSLTYNAQTGPVDQPQFIACAEYTYALESTPTVSAGTARHTFTFQYGNSTWTVIDMGNWNSC